MITSELNLREHEPNLIVNGSVGGDKHTSKASFEPFFTHHTNKHKENTLL